MINCRPKKLSRLNLLGALFLPFSLCSGAAWANATGLLHWDGMSTIESKSDAGFTTSAVVDFMSTTPLWLAMQPTTLATIKFKMSNHTKVAVDKFTLTVAKPNGEAIGALPFGFFIGDRFSITNPELAQPDINPIITTPNSAVFSWNLAGLPSGEGGNSDMFLNLQPIPGWSGFEINNHPWWVGLNLNDNATDISLPALVESMPIPVPISLPEPPEPFPVPIPGGLWLLATGLVLLAGTRRAG